MFKKIAYIVLAVSALSCQKEMKPKPKGELRLEYPQPRYQLLQNNCAYTFEYSDFAKVLDAKKTCWYNMRYPKMDANVYITYFPINNDLDAQVKEVETMVYRHTIKASSIETKSFSYPEKRVFGNFYELKGESASNIQIFITDSTRHFVTANLYFNTRPKPDSLAPAIDYIKKDLLHMVDTFKWKN